VPVKKFFYRVFCGFFLGLSIFAPGFSGSVIAIMLGVYQDLVCIVSNPFKRLKQNILFCLPLGIGAAVSAVLFVIAFKFLFGTYEKAAYLLMVGLTAGNLPEILKQIKKSRRCEDGIKTYLRKT
jgi:putative membrane protein